MRTIGIHLQSNFINVYESKDFSNFYGCVVVEESAHNLQI
jgi:hypothetical protein